MVRCAGANVLTKAYRNFYTLGAWYLYFIDEIGVRTLNRSSRA